jgi:hypothetical protein
MSGPTVIVPSYRRVLGEVGLVLIVLVGLAIGRFVARPGSHALVSPVPAPVPAYPDPDEAAPAMRPSLGSPKVTLPLDAAAVARAEARVKAAGKERERAEEAAAKAAADLKAESMRAAAAALAQKALPETMGDPTARIDRASRRVSTIEAESEKLRAEATKLASIKKPRAKPLVDQSPVAKAAEGEEFHFEVRRDRVTFIDLEKLMEKLRSDARVRLRVAGPGVRRVAGTVGPIGAFSLHYEMLRRVDLIDEVLDMRRSSYDLAGWELVPEAVTRGEALEVASMPTSEYSRAIRRLKPGKSTVTLWVYPDGFEIYRQLRDQLHAKGFQVAARPLPMNVPIRGSPGGTSSASQ